MKLNLKSIIEGRKLWGKKPLSEKSFHHKYNDGSETFVKVILPNDRGYGKNVELQGEEPGWPVVIHKSEWLQIKTHIDSLFKDVKCTKDNGPCSCDKCLGG